MTTDFGSDISTFPGLDPTFALMTGPRVVAEAVARRFITRRGGGLFYDLAYGFDTRSLLNGIVNPSELSLIASQLEEEAKKDERVLDAAVTVTPSTSGNLLALHITTLITTASGPFSFTMTISQVAGQQQFVFGK